jgi:hypothetical protein
MDYRRLDTLGAINDGVLRRGPVDTGEPEGRAEFRGQEHTDEECAQALERGDILNAYNYYGIPRVWKECERYKGVLLQYCNITERLDTGDQAEAVEWFKEYARATDG